jgi:phosphoglycolate phosphatase
MEVRAGALLLWDIDGTMLAQGCTPAHFAAVRAAVLAVYGTAGPPGMRTSGKTELQIGRELLDASPVSPAAPYDDLAAAFCMEAGRQFAARCPADLTGYVTPGIPALLAGLAARPDIRMGLVTGCTRSIAETKLAAAGLAPWFRGGLGGFGDDAEDRAALVPLARRRAGFPGRPWPRGRAVVIGDTPADIGAAHADGVACIGFAGGGDYSVSELAAADWVATGTTELEAAIRGIIDALTCSGPLALPDRG